MDWTFNKQRSTMQQLTSWLFVNLLPASQQEMLFYRWLQKTDAGSLEGFANEHVFVYVYRKTQQAVSDLIDQLADSPRSDKSLPVCKSSLVEEVGYAYMVLLSFLMAAAVCYRLYWVSCMLHVSYVHLIFTYIWLIHGRPHQVIYM